MIHVRRFQDSKRHFYLSLAIGLLTAGLIFLLGTDLRTAQSVFQKSAEAAPTPPFTVFQLESPGVGARSATSQTRSRAAPSGIPLPEECGGINPPGYPVPACCAFGYVYYATATLTESLVAEGAVVTLTTPAGDITSTLTAPGWLNPEGAAYFQFDLDAAGVVSGSVITLAASYLEKQSLTVYQVVTGGQQVDIVLPEARGFEPVVVMVDDQDLAPGPGDPGFSITGAANALSEAGCGPDSEFWDGMIYAGDTTSDGYGPATIQAAYRPSLPLSGAYELFAYAPHGCAGALPQYVLHIAGSLVVTMVVDQNVGGASQGQWVSLGVFDFPAGTDSYVTVNNVTGQPASRPIAFDALKWELHSPFPAIATVTVDDDLDAASAPDEVGFYRMGDNWQAATVWCDGSLVCDPIYWQGHIFWVPTRASGLPHHTAQWRPALPLGGRYEVFTFVPLCFATAISARYQIHLDDVQAAEARVNQAPQGGVWVHVGDYDLPAGASSRLYLDDVTGVAGELLAVDAARWVLRPPFRPVATVHSIRPAAAVQGEEVITLRGGGADTDGGGGEIVAYEWRSNLDGLLSTSDAFSVAAEALSVGVHALTFRVQDDEGLWSQPITTHLKILPPGLAQSWHFMLYLAGDNNLSYHLDRALDRLAAITPPQGVIVTALFDQPGGGGLSRLLLHPGREEWTLAEGNSGDPQTLAAYIRWAQEQYPAQHYYLAIANHGRGIQGLAWDETSGGDYMTLPELRRALQQSTDNGAFKIDVLHLDACLMDMLEVAYEVQPYADYLVASENLAWALFGYDYYVQALTPQTAPRDLAARVARIYHERVGGDPHTIAALDLGQVSTLAGRVDALAGTLLAAWPDEKAALETALGQVQRFDSRDYGRITAQDEFVDLRHLAELLAATSDDAAVQAAAQAVVSATALSQDGVTTTVVYEQRLSGDYGVWWDLDNAHGVAIYFPPAADSWDYGTYLSSTLRFGSDTRWDELLRAHLGDPLGGVEPAPPPPLEMYRVYLPLILRRE